jgi:hypothetical protein
VTDQPAPTHTPEIIYTDRVLKRGDVADVDVIKVRASLWVTFTTLVIATGALIVAAYSGKSDLQTWATGLISAIAGAAISYGFTSRKQD